MTVSELIASVQAPRAADIEQVREHLDDLTKPPGSLGKLEDLAARLAVITGDPPPPLTPRAIIVLAGDHRVAERGVSAYPAEVTVQMCRNIANGGAAVSVLARLAAADLSVADIGVAQPVDDRRVLDRNVVRGAADLAAGPALTANQVDESILAGANILWQRHGEAKLVAVGEMGIGNSTPAAAISAALLELPVDQVLGRGTGIDDEGLSRKRTAVAAGLARLDGDVDPLRVLRQVGGAEIAGMVGVILAAASAKKVVLLDGFISTAAALVATQLQIDCQPYLFASHRSCEPGHSRQLEALRLEPILDLRLRLGEGSGAALAIPVLDGAAAILREMATFSSAGISGSTVESSGSSAAPGGPPEGLSGPSEA